MLTNSLNNFQYCTFHTRMKGSSFLNLFPRGKAPDLATGSESQGKSVCLTRIGPNKHFSIKFLNGSLLDPQFITGFSYGLASFRLTIYKRKDCRTG